MAFNDIIFITAKSHVSQSRYNEVEETFRRNIGKQIETGIRNRIDPGISFRGHQRAQSVKVELTDAGNITIKRDAPEKAVLRPNGKPQRKTTSRNQQDTIDDLFKQSSGVPSVVTGSDGTVQFAFRTIKDTDLFGRSQENQNSNIKRIVDSVVQMNTVGMMDEAVRETERRYPSEQSEEAEVGDEL